MAQTVDPVLQSQISSETLTDPLIRALYFGTEGTPGFYNQLQQAGANLIGYAFLVELTELKGRKNLDSNLFIESLIKY